MKKYSGQAIAIIMVILVVAAVIGASLYSRMIRNKGEVIDTRESSKALEQSGNLLDTFITSDTRELQSALYTKLIGVVGNKVVIESNDGDLEALKNAIDSNFGFIEGLDVTQLVDMDASCSSYSLSFEFATASDGIEYEVGQVMAINVSEVTVPASCQARLQFNRAGGSVDHLFTIKKVFRDKGTGNVEPYELDDMLLYCLPSGVNCANTTVQPVGSISETLSEGGTIDIPMTTAKLHEVRVIPLKNKIRIGIEEIGTCNKIFENYLIKATSVCSGQERTMQVVIPSVTNYGYSPIFDYTIYNSNGGLNPVVL